MGNVRATILCALIALSACMVARVARSDSPLEQTIAFSIPAQSLEDALLDLSRQSSYQIVFASGSLGGRRAPAVSGTMAISQALNLLLAGTELQYKLIGEKTITVGKVPANSDRPTRGDSAQEGKKDSSQDFRVATVDPKPAGNQVIQSSSEKDALTEIVVTAEKRNERLIDTPQSVSVLSGDELNKLGATQFRDWANTVPGLSFTTAGAGFTQITLRGVTDGADVASTVGIYVDDVPYGSSSSFNQAAHHALDVGLFDLDRIEILRGPQGTLYGASTIGGLVKYVTNKPDLDTFAGDVHTGISDTHGGGVGYNVSGVVNIPLITDKMALRVSGYEYHDGGYIDNVALNRTDVNEADIYGGRLDLSIAPTDALSIRLVAFLQDISRDGQATADYTLESVPAFGGSGGAPLYGSLNQHRELEEPFHEQFRLYSATVGYDFGPASLTSISSYQSSSSHEIIDVSAGYVPLFALCPPFCLDYSAIGTSLNLTTDKSTQELRLASHAGGQLEWLIGGFYTHERSANDSSFILHDLTGQPSPNILGTAAEPSTFEEYAGFGDLTWHITSELDVTGGFRYAHNNQAFAQNGTGLFGVTSPRRTSDESVPTYLANTRYHLSDHATAYLRYATGYRPGGPNNVVKDPATGQTIGNSTFGADHLKSYEAGLKSETADRRYAIDLAGYYIDWSDIQVLITDGGFSGLGNAPNAHIQGSEVTFTARPVTSLTSTAAFAYQHAYLSEASPALYAPEGARLPNVPRFTASLNADYLFPSFLQPTVGASVRYVTDRTGGYDNSPVAPQYYLPSYTQVDLRTGLTLVDKSYPVKLQLYVHNLFDNRGQLSVSTTYSNGFGPAQVAILEPRTIGLTLNTSF